MTATEPADAHRVLVNPEGRHALWPTQKPTPTGWQEVLSARPKAECVDYVRRAWSGLDRRPARNRRATRIEFGIMFFGGGEYAAARRKYDLVIDTSRFADQNGFTAMWFPERHFTSIGCLYPNPAVLLAALARETSRIRLRAGSVVLPLHDPIRVAEDWAVVDNLSGGRIDISFAPGWNPEDFALQPDRYARRYDEMYAGIETIKRLWSGRTIPARSGTGAPMDLRIYPSPIQTKLPMWLTAAGAPETFRKAGSTGSNLLTHLFDMSVEKLGEMIALYRQSRREAGWGPEPGRVAVALHTFVAGDLEAVRAHSFQPYCDYLKSNAKLLEKLATSRGLDIDIAAMGPSQLDDAVAYLFEKFLRGRSLLGTPETCAALVEQLIEVGVDEIACLLDFGPEPDAIRATLPYLARLRERFA